MFVHHCVILRELAFITLPNYISTVRSSQHNTTHSLTNNQTLYVPGGHNSNINTQIVYTASIQTSCNNNHSITLDNSNVLKILLILTRAAIVLM